MLSTKASWPPWRLSNHQHSLQELAARERRIQQTSQQCHGGSMEVSCLACGPAHEVQDHFHCHHCNHSHPVTFNLFDNNLNVLAFVKVWVESDEHVAKCQDEVECMKTHSSNVLCLFAGGSKDSGSKPPPQDFICSVGLMDCFQDKLVVCVMDWICNNLRTLGYFGLGNFCPWNTSCHMLELQHPRFK